MAVVPAGGILGQGRKGTDNKIPMTVWIDKRALVRTHFVNHHPPHLHFKWGWTERKKRRKSSKNPAQLSLQTRIESYYPSVWTPHGWGLLFHLSLFSVFHPRTLAGGHPVPPSHRCKRCHFLQEQQHPDGVVVVYFVTLEPRPESAF